METTLDVTDVLSRMALFADLSRSNVEAASHAFEEISVGPGDRLLRTGFAGNGFYVILSGAANVEVDGETMMTLFRGDFFGEVSLLLDLPATADVVASTPLRCLLLPGGELNAFLLSYPQVMFRLLQAIALRAAKPFEWHA